MSFDLGDTKLSNSDIDHDPSETKLEENASKGEEVDQNRDVNKDTSEAKLGEDASKSQKVEIDEVFSFEAKLVENASKGEEVDQKGHANRETSEAKLEENASKSQDIEIDEVSSEAKLVENGPGLLDAKLEGDASEEKIVGEEFEEETLKIQMLDAYEDDSYQGTVASDDETDNPVEEFGDIESYMVDMKPSIDEESFQLEAPESTTGPRSPTKSVVFVGLLEGEDEAEKEDEEDEKVASEEHLPEEPTDDSRRTSTSVSLASLFAEQDRKKEGEELLDTVLEAIESGMLVEEEPAVEDSDRSLERLIEMNRQFLLAPVEEEEEEEEEQEQEEEIEVDRNMYYQMYDLYKNKLAKERTTNVLLQRAMSKYYLHRRMFYVLKEAGPLIQEVVEKYQSDLDHLEESYEASERKKTQNLDDVGRLQWKCEEKGEELKNEFEKLQQMEKDYTKGLRIDDSMARYLDRLIKRQKIITDSLINIRKEYIDQKNKVQRKTDALRHLDHLGLGFHIMDFVQLKNQHQKLKDRFDDKIQELVKFRAKCQSHSQVLAHNREKNNLVDTKIAEGKDRIEELITESNQTRQDLAFFRTQLNIHRDDVIKLKEETGLLAYPKMVRNMEKAMDELNNLQEVSEKVQRDCVVKADHVKAVRAHLELMNRRKKQFGKSAKVKGGVKPEVSSISVSSISVSSISVDPTKSFSGSTGTFNSSSMSRSFSSMMANK